MEDILGVLAETLASQLFKVRLTHCFQSSRPSKTGRDCLLLGRMALALSTPMLILICTSTPFSPFHVFCFVSGVQSAPHLPYSSFNPSFPLSSLSLLHPTLLLLFILFPTIYPSLLSFLLYSFLLHSYFAVTFSFQFLHTSVTFFSTYFYSVFCGFYCRTGKDTLKEIKIGKSRRKREGSNSCLRMEEKKQKVE
ncbi:hypothetical protein HOY80DRAFT_688521 [Tuber brumale]|nr:hypothetical protein HOY80DRAFT_688521 [Tuber brumale]